MYAVWLIAPVEDSLDKRIFCVSVLSYAEGEARFVVTQLNPQTGKYATALDSAILHVVEYLVVLSFLTAQSLTEAVRQLTQSVVGKLKSTRVETIGGVEMTAKKVFHRELSYIGGSKQTDEGLVLSCSHNSSFLGLVKRNPHVSDVRIIQAIPFSPPSRRQSKEESNISAPPSIRRRRCT